MKCPFRQFFLIEDITPCQCIIYLYPIMESPFQTDSLIFLTFIEQHFSAYFHVLFCDFCEVFLAPLQSNYTIKGSHFKDFAPMKEIDNTHLPHLSFPTVNGTGNYWVKDEPKHVCSAISCHQAIQILVPSPWSGCEDVPSQDLMFMCHFMRSFMNLHEEFHVIPAESW